MSGWKENGVLCLKDISEVIPSQERLLAGPVAIIECIERIPCDPCVDACPFDAIFIEGGMVEKPQMDFEKCTGCGNCVSACPGLAIFMVDFTYSNHKAKLLIPYEFIPLPTPGDRVQGLDRRGKALTEVKVLEVKKENGTGLISIAVDKNLAMDIRNIEFDCK